MPLTSQDFVSKWKRVTAREKQTYQEHFLDLCNLVGHQTPNDYDPTGKRFAFEMGVAKTSGGQGWADVAKLGFFGWEYKGKDSDLEKAYDQLLRYRDSLHNPPLLIVSDINNIIIRTNYTNLPTRTFTLTLDDLLKPESINILKTVFFAPEQLKPQITIEGVTREAAAQFSKLADNLRKYGSDPQEIAHFLIRLLFCLFAEDIGLLPEKLFPRLLEQTRHNSKDFSEVLRQLFRAMNTGGYFGSDKILHFNGGLFDNENVLPLDSADMDIIADIDALDWGAIEPSIFGTLFERGLDPSKRSQLGAHYTSKEDILLIVEPVLMAPLRREWKELQVECLELREEGDREKGKKAEGVRKKISEKLRGFADKITATRVLDPACGSGNFLYVALRLLLDLQNEVINFSDEMGAGRFFISVTPAQLYGIETNEYAYELAQMTIQIGYIQWLRDNGYGQPAEPILKPMKNILHMDAILSPKSDNTNSIDNQNSSVFGGDVRRTEGAEPAWPQVDVIIGNPPFLGDKKMRAELGHQYVEDLRKLYGDRIPGQSDLVCYWFEKARAMIERGEAKRAGLLATQAIRHGLNRTVLDRIKQTGNIFWGIQNQEWILDGASVRVSMVGFDNGTETIFELDQAIVPSINSDLTSAIDLTEAKQLLENANLAFIGTQKGGPFDIPEAVAIIMLSNAGNPNGLPNSDVIKPWTNAMDITSQNRHMWIIDFGSYMSQDEASKYEMPFEYVKKNVYPVRKDLRRENHKKYWWIHAESRPGMRQAMSGLKRYIATPRVAKHRVFVWLDVSVLPDSRLLVIACDDDYFFGVLHSHIHEIWGLEMGSRHGDGGEGGRPVYNAESCFETFPFPWAPGAEPKDDPRVQAIGQAAKELVEQRDRWLNVEGLSDSEKKKRTLTNLYNARPTWLDLAHKRLDEAVFAAYGWKSDMSDEEILERLLSLNLERSK
jgi:restriction-modification enzyme MmeI-like protein